MFSKDDRNLLIRVGKVLQEQLAEANAQIQADKPGSLNFKTAKAKRNRLLRDNTDLIALRKRIEAAAAAAANNPQTSD